MVASRLVTDDVARGDLAGGEETEVLCIDGEGLLHGHPASRVGRVLDLVSEEVLELAPERLEVDVADRGIPVLAARDLEDKRLRATQGIKSDAVVALAIASDETVDLHPAGAALFGNGVVGEVVLHGVVSFRGCVG